MEGITTAIVLFIFVCILFPRIVKHRTQFYTAFGLIIVMLLFHTLARMFGNERFFNFVGVVNGLLQLAALVLVVLATGWSLPVRHRATRAATYPVSAESLFAILGDVERFPTWRSTVERVDVLPPTDGRARFRETGGGDAILYEVVESVPGRRLVTRIADPTLPFGGTWTYELAPANDAGTTLRITEDGEVYSPVYRFVSRFMMGHHRTIDTFLRDLGRRLGTEPEIAA